MNRMTALRGRGRVATLAALSAGALVLAGCAGGAAEEEGPVEITFWTWLPDVQKTVDLFEEAHPDITVNVENVGVYTDEYTKIQNAVDAGSGGPDVAHVTYESIPNFALSGALADLTDLGGAEAEELFLPGAFGQVKINDGIYGIPQDFGPGVMYYRADIFEQAGIPVPTTWDEYRAAAEALTAANPDQSITYFDPGLADAAYMGLWQLGAEPWAVEGEEISLDLGNEAVTQWADYWGDLNADGLLVESVQGSDEWFKQLNDGTIVTWIVGAWGLQALTGNVPDGDGLWRVAPQPTWDGTPATSQFGGSGTVVLEQSAHKEAAATFAIWMNSDPVAVQSLKDDQGLLPTTLELWEDPAFIDEEIAYLGGQQARQVFARSAEDTVPGWTWLPFQIYVNGIYKDTVGQAISGKTSLADGFAAWQERIAEYAEEQGYTVSAD